MVPNVFPIVMLLGIMGWAGIDLNICTSTIASISIGIAVDDTIHYMLGFHDELRARRHARGGDPRHPAPASAARSSSPRSR